MGLVLDLGCARIKVVAFEKNRVKGITACSAIAMLVTCRFFSEAMKKGLRR